MSKFKVGSKVIICSVPEDHIGIPPYASKFEGTIGTIRQMFNTLHVVVCFDGNILYLYENEILVCDDAHQLLY